MGVLARRGAELDDHPPDKATHQPPSKLRNRRQPPKENHLQEPGPRSPPTSNTTDFQTLQSTISDDEPTPPSRDDHPINTSGNTEERYKSTNTWAPCLNKWRQMATIDLRGTEAENCQITRVLADALQDTLDTLETILLQQSQNILDRKQLTQQDDHYKSLTMLENNLNTPSAQIAFAAEDPAPNDQLEPRNLVNELEQANQQREENLLTMSAEHSRDSKSVTLYTPDTRMLTPSAFLRSSPEIRVTNITSGHIQELVNKVDGLIARESYMQSDITSIKQKQAKYDSVAAKIDNIEKQVSLNTRTLEDHEVGIKDAGEVSEAIISRFGEMFSEVRDQAKKTGSQLELLTALVEKQQAVGNGNTATDGVDPRVGNNQIEYNGNSETPHNRGWERRKDMTPQPIDESQVVAWDDPVNELIDHHLEGLSLLYFTRAKYGNISTIRELIEAQLKLGRVIKAINFVGDSDNFVTEVCVQAKNERAVLTRAAMVAQDRRVLGEHLVNHNPYVPIWRNAKGWTDALRQKREVNHVRKLVGQWQQCAEKSKVARVKEFYAERLSCVQVEDKIFWDKLVYKIVVDLTRQQQPKVYLNEEEERRLTAHKRKADGQLGPSREILNSVERRPKGHKCNDTKEAGETDTKQEEDKDMVEDLDTVDLDPEEDEEDLEMMTPEINPEEQRREGKTVAGPSTERGSGTAAAESAHRPPLAPKDMNVKLKQPGITKKTRAPKAQDANKKTRTVSGATATGATVPAEE